MIVEFAGLPGSGKTTAANALVRSAQEAGANARRAALAPHIAAGRVRGKHVRTLLLARARAASLIRHRAMVGAAVSGLGGSDRNWAEKRYAFRHVAVTAAALDHARRTAPMEDLLVFPEGICQKAFSAFVDGGGITAPATVRRFIRGAPHPHVVVLLLVDPSIAYGRVHSRGYGALSYRFGGLSEHQVVERFRAAQHMLIDAADHLRHVSDPPVKIARLQADDLSGALETLRFRVLPALLDRLVPPGDQASG